MSRECGERLVSEWSGPAGRRRGGWCGIAVVVVLCGAFLPTSAAAEEGGDASSAGGTVRDAGNEASFRVIERFSGGDSARSDRESRREGGVDESGFELRISADVEAEMRRDEWSAALEQLERRIGTFGPQLRFLRAYLQFRSGAYEEAGRNFEVVRSELPVVADYAALYGARCAEERGEHHRAVVRAARVNPESRLHAEALAVLARNLVDAGAEADLPRARRVMERYLRRYPSGEHASALRLELGRLAAEGGDWEVVAEQAFRILEEDPLSEPADEAEQLLEEHVSKLPEPWRRKVDDRPRTYELAYYRALFEHHRSEKLVEMLEEPLSSWTPGGRDRCRGLYWMGKSYTKLRRHEEAAEWYERILEECAGVDPFEKKALYLGAKSYWNVDEEKRALSLYRRLWTEFDAHSFADDALHFAARIHRESGRTERATELLERQVERYPEGDMAGDAHWLRVRSLYEDGAFGAVVDYVETLDRSGEAEPGARGRLDYFLGRALEQEGNAGRAREVYLEVANSHPLRYYALLALNRLARIEGGGGPEDLCGDEAAAFCDRLEIGAAAEELPDFEMPRRVRVASAYEKGTFLLALGVRDWAESEFDALFQQFSDDRDAVMAISDLLDRAGAYSLSYSLPARAEGWAETYPGGPTRRLWEIAYPRAYEPVVRRWSRERGLDTAVPFAVMRKESGFRADAESWANARGLMQLMWGTAQGVATDEGVSNLEKSDLLEVETNVRLGTAYLAELADRFQGHPALVVAGYNGGAGNVGGWLENRPGMPLDLWVEDIPYGQTRRYAKVGLGFFWAYRWLYDDGAVPRLEFDLSTATDGGGAAE